MFKAGSWLLILFFLLAVSRQACASGAGAPYFTDLGQFNYAKFLMDEGEYRTAAREFGRLIESFPGSQLISEAQFRMAEAYLYSGEYREAEAQFRLYISNFIDSPFSIVAEIKMQEARDKLKKVSPQPALPEIYREMRPNLRAVQVMLFEGKDNREMGREMDRLKDAGIDTIIVRAFHNSGDRFYPAASPAEKRGVYFRSNHSLVVDDLLPKVIELAHARGLKVFAWMTTRYADYGIEDNAELACVAYDIRNMEYGRCKGLDLFNEKSLERLDKIYSDLADNAIDGVLFQDDLVMRHNEGLGKIARALFEKDTGSPLDPEALYIRTEEGKVHYTELFWKWASWKNRRLVNAAERLKRGVRAKRPTAVFAIHLMYESVTNPPYALAWLSQDLSEALRADFDYFSIMAYHRQIGEELEKPIPEVRDMIVKMANDASIAVGESKRVLIKIQTIDWRTGSKLSDEEVVDIIREIKGAGDFSLAVVPYRVDFPFNELAAGKVALAGPHTGAGVKQ